MKKNLLRAIPVILVLCSAILFFSCSQDDSDIIIPQNELAISDPQIKKEIEFMKSEGMIDSITYDRWLTLSKAELIYTGGAPKEISTGVIQEPEYYLYNEPHAMDGTIVHRNEIQKMILEKEANISSRMKRQPHMFDSNGGTITIRVVESGTYAVPLAWKQALGEAILTWNALGLKVQFSKVTASNASIVGGYLTIRYENMSSYPTVFAYTEPVKSPGYFSEYMAINFHPGNTPDLNGKKFTMIHELGHAIGLAHTEKAPDGSTIFHTAVTCNETNNANSFMYGSGSHTKLFTGFSVCDLQNLQYYWGYGSTLS